jgi:N-acetylglucosaminyl-diphospho-decaprenol L-rhamnosyltransferase
VAEAFAGPTVGIVVVNWRRADDTIAVMGDVAAADRALRDAGLGGARLVVVDNESAAEERERIERAGVALGGAFTLRAEESNLGYCEAVAAGLDVLRATGAPPFVLLLNNDVRFAPDVLPGLVAVLVNDPRLAGVMPVVVFPGGETAWSCGGEVGAFPNLTRMVGHDRPPPSRDVGPVEVEYLPGAFALYRDEDLAAVGGLEAGYFMYWEDADLGARLRARVPARGLVCLPWFRVEHAAGSSSGGRVSPLRKYLMGRNAIVYLRQHGTARLWFAWIVFELFGAVLALALACVRNAPARRAALAKIAGVRAGLRGAGVGGDDVRRLVRSPPKD